MLRRPPASAFGLPWPLFWAEAVGTFLLVAVGCSLVIFMYGAGSPAAHLPPDPTRRVLTGFLFGSTGALITFSWVGRESGAHLNPVVTLAFWRLGRLKGRYVPGYLLAQLLGGALGGLPLLGWGAMGRGVQFAATVPGAAGPWVALLGEAGCTFILLTGLFFFLGRPRLRRYTPLLFPFLYALLVGLEAPFSGTSTNPARSLGPALAGGVWTDHWVYWAGPLLGGGLAVWLLGRVRRLEAHVAKFYHFGHDPHQVFTPPPQWGQRSDHADL